MKHRYKVSVESPVLLIEITANTDTSDDRIAPAIGKIMEIVREFHNDSEVTTVLEEPKGNRLPHFAGVISQDGNQEQE